MGAPTPMDPADGRPRSSASGPVPGAGPDGSVAGVALFGGAFNPPHRTHRRIAAAALEQLAIGSLHVIPTGDHPHKSGDGLAPGADRLEMCRRAFRDLPGVVVDDREILRAGPSYSLDTVREIATEGLAPGTPPRRIHWILGSDNLPGLPTWSRFHDLLAACTVVVFPRAGYPIDPDAVADPAFSPAERESLLRHALEMPADDRNATDIRAALRHTDPPHPDLDPEVEEWIRARGLYGCPGPT